MPKRSQKKKKEPTAWEIAKPILTNDILEGKVNARMCYKEIQKSKTVYQAVPEARFKENLKNLRSRIRFDKMRAARDVAAALRCDNVVLPGLNKTPPNLVANNNQPPNVDDVARLPTISYPHWDGSNAQRLLKQAVKEGRHVGIAPRKLRGTKTEFQKFPVRVFQKHVNQEVNANPTSNYWQAKQAKRAKNAPPSVDMPPRADEDGEEGATDGEASV
jgi:hypothetical protein